MRMSFFTRWRSRLMHCPRAVMSMLLLSDEANRVVSQHKKQGVFTVTNRHAGTGEDPRERFSPLNNDSNKPAKAGLPSRFYEQK
jgi:hypothetical protein